MAASFDIINDITGRENCQIKVKASFDKCKCNPGCIRTCQNTGLETNYLEDVIYLCEDAHLMYNMYTTIEVKNMYTTIEVKTTRCIKMFSAFCAMFSGTSVLKRRL